MNNKEKGLNISTKSFITAIAVIFALMVLTYLLTLTVSGGEYPRVTDQNGNTVIDTNGKFYFVAGGIPFWQWLLSPILVLGASGSGALIAVIIFLIVIGGVFAAIDKCGLMSYMLNKTVNKFGTVRYRLMAVIMFFFMTMGALIGSFEECVPLVPIVVALAVSLGWDPLTGVAMSLLSVGCGFASGVFNPFTVGVAQQLASLPMFSGAWLRLVAFVAIYLLLFLFVYIYAKKHESPLQQDVVGNFVKDPKMDKALWLFGGIVGFGIVIILSSGFVTALQDYTMIIVAITFLAAGIISVLASGMSGKKNVKQYAGRR